LENRLGAGLVQHTMQTNPAVEQSRIIRWFESPCNQPVGKQKVQGGKDLLKSQVLSSE